MKNFIGVVVAGLMMASPAVALEPGLIQNRYLLESWSCKGTADFGNSSFDVEHQIHYYKDHTMTVCSVVDNNRSSSMTYIWNDPQEGFGKGNCNVRYDVDEPSRGYFSFIFNSLTGSSTMNYNDIYSDMFILNPSITCSKI